jgi:hypothetical protein
MATTAFALFQSPLESTVDTYVREHTVFFLDLSKSGLSWLDETLRQAIQHAAVSTPQHLVSQSNQFLGFYASRHLETIVRSSPSHSRLATNCT